MQIKLLSLQQTLFTNHNREKGDYLTYKHHIYTAHQHSFKNTQILAVKIAYNYDITEKQKIIIDLLLQNNCKRKVVAAILGVNASTVTKQLQAVKKRVTDIYNWLKIFDRYYLTDNQIIDILKLKSKIENNKKLSECEKDFLYKIFLDKRVGQAYFIECYIKNEKITDIAYKYSVNNSTVSRGIKSYKTYLLQILNVYCFYEKLKRSKKYE